MFTDRKTPPDEADRLVQRLLSVRDVRSLEELRSLLPGLAGRSDAELTHIMDRMRQRNASMKQRLKRRR